MIRPNELKIGNWVYIPSRKEEGVELPAKISELRSTDVTTLDNTKRSDSYLCLNPIPLTEDLILKCGFKQDVRLERIFRHGYISLMHFGTWSLFNEQEDMSFLDLPLEHLHQLQNLYFAITGEELDVKL